MAFWSKSNNDEPSTQAMDAYREAVRVVMAEHGTTDIMDIDACEVYQYTTQEAETLTREEYTQVRRALGHQS